jgi:uncharacterized membrane protein YphA (DoxX/SURF4 family)
MRNIAYNIFIPEIISSLFILLFVYTGLSKLNEHDSFRAVLSQSPLIESKADFISWALPIIELCAALLLLFPFTRKYGILVSFILMIIFTGYVGYMILSRRHLPCSCGGVLKQMTWIQHLEFNVLFTALAFIGMLLFPNKKLFIAINRSSRKPV